ncbi:hypothetical protein EDEG_02134 [Edhazardia aedis USNM 41457]|uniref:DNA-directed RNA polymerase RBP11-like dimerisation domain-containing protein n=1 Tax=Edhazardia aedis (strain USNM 41457) TaxID=1003232 RepID=J9DLV1_EDHAE|nr:hypothetical protein EDEG_02134 [Edhazardia aedis USNM 41457]|eukprot:EJW03550.1 hypothetical protein EDEG_02134 [Edhazardia aedis USNM 41457]
MFQKNHAFDNAMGPCNRQIIGNKLVVSFFMFFKVFLIYCLTKRFFICFPFIFYNSMNTQRKLNVIRDQTASNTVELEIHGETHTLGNILADRLLQDTRCVFAAYKVPHPLEEKVMVRVTSAKNCDVMELINDALMSLSSEIEDAKVQFERQEKKGVPFSRI